ncbi:MAG: glycosyltransferase family 4 protein [Phycisphaerales bacterium]
MRILSIVQDLGPGGTQRVAADVAAAYKELGYESAVLTTRGTGPRAQALLDAGVEVFAASQELKETDTPWNNAARQWKPDIIHFHRTGHAEKAQGQLIRFLNTESPTRIPVIEHSHFGRVDRSPDAELIDVHIQITRWCFWRWRQWGRGVKPEPIGVYIPHMIDSNRFTPATDEDSKTFRSSNNIPENAFVFGYLAQPHPFKWSPHLFNAFKEVAQKHDHAYLMIAGIGDNSKKHFEHFPQHIKSRIIILPFIHGDEGLRQAYSAMDTFVLATEIGETFGLVLAEAMCCHTPAITLATPTRGNGQTEVVGHERGGLIAANPKSIAIAMDRIMTDHTLRAHCAAAGRAHIQSAYNKQHITAQLNELVIAVHESNTRQDLLSRITQSKPLISKVTKRDLHESWGGMIGSFSLKQKITQKLVFSPLLQILWNNYALPIKIKLFRKPNAAPPPPTNQNTAATKDPANDRIKASK